MIKLSLRTCVKFLILVPMLIFVFQSCLFDDEIRMSTYSDLSFSEDTITFDTIFTSFGSTTQTLKIYNQSSDLISISSIRLLDLDESYFRLNIDGVEASELFNVPIYPNDSLFVFVEITIPEHDENRPFLISDSIEVETDDGAHYVALQAWGQDFILYDNQQIMSEHWDSLRPYLIYDTLTVLEGETLNIGPGSQVYMHDNSKIFVEGQLTVQGTSDAPVVFQADRLEEVYDDVPSQWHGIILGAEKKHILDHVKIKNGITGLQINMSDVELKDVELSNFSYAGILAIGANLKAGDVLIHNCYYYGLAAIYGGSYEINHMTLANYTDATRETPSLFIQDYIYQDNTVYVNPLNKFSIQNSIVTGGNRSELGFDFAEEGNEKIFVNHSIVKYAQTFDPEIFDTNSMFEFSDSTFIDVYQGDFNLHQKSNAIDNADAEQSILIPYDMNGNNRFADENPDIGVFEYIP